MFLFSVFGGFFNICGTFSLGTMGFERTSMLTWLFQCDFQDEALAAGSPNLNHLPGHGVFQPQGLSRRNTPNPSPTLKKPIR